MRDFALLRAACALCLALLAILAVAAPVPAQEVAPAAESAPGLSPEQARTLAELLKDEAARGAVLSELEKIAAAAAPDAAEAGGDTAPDPEQVSLGRQIAETTQAFAQNVAAGATRFWEQLKRAPRALSAAGDLESEVLLQAVLDLALVVITTFAAFFLYRLVARRVYRVMGSAAAGSGTWRTAMIITVSIVIDAGVVVLAWATGYLVSLTVVGDTGTIGIRQTLFLNAFLLVEMIKVLVRSVLAPTTEALRPVNLSNRAARVLSGWMTTIVGLLGYGQMLVVPIVNQNVSWLAGRSFSTIISLLAVAITVGLVLAYRRAVADWLTGGPKTKRSGLWRFLCRNWQVPVLLYLVALFGIVLTRPGGILFPLLGTTAKVIAAVLVGAIVANLLGRAMARGVQLPERVTARLPLLERRLNSFVPRALLVVRFAIIAAVVAFAIDAVDLFDVAGWLEGAVGRQMTETILSVALVLLLAFALWLALSSWIDYRLNAEFGAVPTAREQTLLGLLRNAATIVLVVITTMFVLSEIGIDIAPLIASAGVLGLAIGFGAQKMVQDIITGIFIQFENAMNVGDVVTVGGTTGTVERLTIRSVSLRDLQGVFHIIPFSSVDMVSNHMRGFGHFVCDMGIAYRESIDDAKQAMLDAFAELKANPDWSGAILGDLQWFGLQAFGDSAVVVRARIKCVPGQQWGVGRAYNEIVKRIFDERGIEIPFPHQTIYFGEDKQGKAPPVHVKGLPEGTPRAAE